jgi:hypothetical protein
LKSFINVLKDYAEREKATREKLVAVHEKALQWMVLNALDSIPLSTAMINKKFKPLSVVTEKYTVGLHYTDSITALGYFYTITPSRVPDIKINFPVDKAAFSQARLNNAKSLTFADAAGQIYFVLMYSDKPTAESKDKAAPPAGKYVATLAKIYRSDGLAWSSNYLLPFVPKEVSFKQDTGELVIRADAQESVIDKNGKLLR